MEQAHRHSRIFLVRIFWGVIQEARGRKREIPDGVSTGISVLSPQVRGEGGYQSRFGARGVTGVWKTLSGLLPDPPPYSGSNL